MQIVRATQTHRFVHVTWYAHAILSAPVTSYKEDNMYSRRNIIQSAFLLVSSSVIFPKLLLPEPFCHEAELENPTHSGNYIPVKTGMFNERLKGNQIVLSSSTEEVVLNSIGSFIWMQIDGKRNTFTIAERIEKIYSVAPEIALNDSSTFLQKMADKSYLQLKT